MLDQKAFTLMELLIVVAIIGILVLIVVPNFLNAQIRAKVARSQADIRAVVNSILAYRVDNNAIPPRLESKGTATIIKPTHVSVLTQLTTPITYISAGSVNSPFSPYHGYWYYNWDFFLKTSGEVPLWYYNNITNQEKSLWMVHTIGPNGKENPWVEVNDKIMWMDYNPSNGIASRGVIQIHGG